MLIHAHIAFMLFYLKVILLVGVIAQSKMGILKDCFFTLPCLKQKGSS